MNHSLRADVSGDFDKPLQEIAQYVDSFSSENKDLAYETARYCLMDSVGCAILALRYPECTKLLGPIVPGTIVPAGISVTTLSLTNSIGIRN